MPDSVEMLFADNVTQVQVTGGIVRLLLGTNKPRLGDDDNTPPEVVNDQCLIMPIEGFLRTLQIFQQAVDSLEKRGVLKRGAQDPQSQEDIPQVSIGNGD